MPGAQQTLREDLLNESSEAGTIIPILQMATQSLERLGHAPTVTSQHGAGLGLEPGGLASEPIPITSVLGGDVTGCRH